MTKEKILNLTQDEWATSVNNDEQAVILDVRTAEECASGVIENAIHIDIMKGQGFIYELEKLDPNLNYYVYCRSGNRSGQACSIMQEMGFKNTFNLQGGTMQWNGKLIIQN